MVKELKAVYGEGSVIGNKCDVTNASELEGARRLMIFLVIYLFRDILTFL